MRVGNSPFPCNLFFPKPQPASLPMPVTGLQGSSDSFTHVPVCLFCLLRASIINFKLPVLTFKASLHFESVFIASLIFPVSPSLAPTPNSGHSSKFLHIPGTIIPHPLPPPFPPSSVKLSLISLIFPNPKKNLKKLSSDTINRCIFNFLLAGLVTDH